MEKPILFSTEMVRAILDGRKTQTRRIAKKIPVETHRVEQLDNNLFEAHWGGYAPDMQAFLDGSTEIKSRYQPGDIFWVRKTWAQLKKPDGSSRFVYKASDEYPFGEKYIVKFKWKPSIHMPKEAARLFLKVKNVRVERLQDITEDDAKAEGVQLNYGANDPRNCKWQNYRDAFKALWNDINKTRGYGWDINPWIWVIEFAVKEADAS